MHRNVPIWIRNRRRELFREEGQRVRRVGRVGAVIFDCEIETLCNGEPRLRRALSKATVLAFPEMYGHGFLGLNCITAYSAAKISILYRKPEYDRDHRRWLTVAGVLHLVITDEATAEILGGEGKSSVTEDSCVLAMWIRSKMLV